jgi:hypothetical protein
VSGIYCNSLRDNRNRYFAIRWRVSGFMVHDLKQQECMHCVCSFWACEQGMKRRVEWWADTNQLGLP